MLNILKNIKFQFKFSSWNQEKSVQLHHSPLISLQFCINAVSTKKKTLCAKLLSIYSLFPSFSLFSIENLKDKNCNVNNNLKCHTFFLVSFLLNYQLIVIESEELKSFTFIFTTMIEDQFPVFFTYFEINSQIRVNERSKSFLFLYNYSTWTVRNVSWTTINGAKESIRLSFIAYLWPSGIKDDFYYFSSSWWF